FDRGFSNRDAEITSAIGMTIVPRTPRNDRRHLRHTTYFLILTLCVASIASAGFRAARAAEWSIGGTVMTPDTVIQDGVVRIADEKIAGVGPQGSVAAKGSPLILPGIILPGLVDLHNHLSWNVLQRWLPARKFANRYEWQDFAEYDRSLV